MKIVSLLVAVFATFSLDACRVESVSRSTSESTQRTSGGADSLEVIPAPRMNFVISKTPIRLQDEFRTFVSNVRSRQGSTELHCAQVTDINGLILCAGTNPDSHHFPLMRAAIFSEGRPSIQVPSAGLIVSGAKAREAWEKSSGHDLKDTHLKNFFMSLKNTCPDASCIDQNEFVFADKIVPIFYQKSPQGFSVISFDVSNESIENAVSHEIAHGQFFQQPQYRSAVLNWYNALPFVVQQRAVQVIGLNYDIRVPDLLVNEFHAYVLMGKFDFSIEKYNQLMQANDPTAANIATIMQQAPQLKQLLRMAIAAAGLPIWAGAF